MASKPNPSGLPLAQFADEVRRLDAEAVLPAESRAGLLPLTDEMLAFFYNAGFTPQETVLEMTTDAEAELLFESLGS